eukprot:Skav208831  [mRNA]  locus=scaffold1193:4457:28059:+ [translate_table: standard]
MMELPRLRRKSRVLPLLAVALCLALAPGDHSAPSTARVPEVGSGHMALLAVAALVVLPSLPMLLPLLQYWRIMFFFWSNGRYAEAKARFDLNGRSCGHLYSLAMVPWLMSKPHYRTGTFREDMRTNLRNVVLPTGFFGMPLSIWAYSRLHAVVAILFVLPTAAFVGSWYRRIFGMDSAYVCFKRTLFEPRDWFQLWRLNCRLASMTAYAIHDKTKDFEREDKWNFIKGCLDNNLPTTPALDVPKTLVAKDVNEEGGMGIHVLKNVLHGGNWLLQEKLDNHPEVGKLLPKECPLSTMRVVWCLEAPRRTC